MTKQTDPRTAGGATSEGRLNLGALVIGGLVAIVGGLAPFFVEVAHNYPGVWWIQLAALVIGSLATTLTARSYGDTRTALKLKLLELDEGEPAAPAASSTEVKVQVGSSPP
jgi:uncharacterized membrane protein